MFHPVELSFILDSSLLVSVATSDCGAPPILKTVVIFCLFVFLAVILPLDVFFFHFKVPSVGHTSTGI